jgi:EmrB/QacA subfamily drug resistance transporter
MAATAHPRRWAILGVLILALFGVTLDNTILNIALPTIATDLTASAAQLQWMVDAYILVFAGLLLVAGAMSDRFGRRLLLVVGLATFGMGSALAPLVGSAEQLILLRAFMGLGAAMTMPSTLSIIAEVFTADERPKAIAAWSAVSGLGIVVGPIVGGWLLEHFHWTSVFVVNVPFVIIGIAAALAVVPESKAPGRVPLDPLGAALSVAGLVTLVYGIIEVPVRGFGDPVVIGSLGAAAAFLGTFIWWERRVAHPMLDLRLFANPRFSAASLSVTLAFFSLAASLFFLTQYLQGVLGLGALETGLRFIPIAVGIVLAASISARLTARFGAGIVTALGLALTAAGLALMSTVGTTATDLHVGAVLFVIAGGIGIAITPSTDAIMGALPREQFGLGSAVNDTTREVGAAMGVAVLGSVFAGGYGASMTDAVRGLPEAAAAAARDSLAAAGVVAAQLGGEAGGAALLAAARSAFVEAMSFTSLIGVGFALAGAVVALVFLPAREAGRRADATADSAAAGGAVRDAGGVAELGEAAAAA